MNWHARYYSNNKDRILLVARNRRKTDVAQAILSDSRRADRKRGRANDLDVIHVRSLIEQHCSYCGESNLRMTIDRINNAIGHVRANVVPACERCNYARRDMPYSAWLLVARAMREARELGLFGDWTGGIHRRRALEEVPLLPTREPPPHGTLARYHKCGPPRCDECRRAMRDWKRIRRGKGEHKMDTPDSDDRLEP